MRFFRRRRKARLVVVDEDDPILVELLQRTWETGHAWSWDTARGFHDHGEP